MVGFGLVEGLVEFMQNGGRERVAFAIVDADGGDVVLVGVVDEVGHCLRILDIVRSIDL